MSVASIITQLAVIERTIEGVKRAYDKTPESLSEPPAVINFPSAGELKRHTAGGTRRATHRIKIQLFVTRADLPSAENLLRPFIERFPDKIDQNIFINGTCTTSEIISYKYGEMEFAKTQYLGIEYILEVKEDTTINFSG